MPATGGKFAVDLLYLREVENGGVGETCLVKREIWERKKEGGFPGTFSLSVFEMLSRSCGCSHFIDVLLNM